MNKKEPRWITIEANTDPNETSYLELGSSANGRNNPNSDPNFHTTTKMGNAEFGNNDVTSAFPVWNLDVTQFEARNNLEANYRLNGESRTSSNQNKVNLEPRYQKTNVNNQTSNKPTNTIVSFRKPKIEPKVQAHEDFWSKYLNNIPLNPEGNIPTPEAHFDTQPKSSKTLEALASLREKTSQVTSQIANKYNMTIAYINQIGVEITQKSKNFINKSANKIGEKITEYGEKYGSNLDLDGNSYGKDNSQNINSTKNSQPQSHKQAQPNLSEKFSSRLQSLKQSTANWWKK